MKIIIKTIKPKSNVSGTQWKITIYLKALHVRFADKCELRILFVF